MHGGSDVATRTGSAAIAKGQPSVLSLPALWKGHQPAGAGLSNLGNSCYLNSTLQCLAYVPPLAHLCLGRGHSSSCPRASAAGATGASPLSRAMGTLPPVSGPCTFCIMERQLAAQLRGSRGVAVSPSELFRNLHLFSRSFVRGRQEDSHELLTAVLDVMERDGRRAAMAHGAPKGCRTIVEDLFVGRWQSQVRCLVCGYESNTYETFATLPLDIGQARTVAEGLRAFTEAERLDGNNKYKCDKCRQLVPAVKQTTIWDDPNVLVLHLKRFDAGSLLGKVTRHVGFSEHIDLQPFLTPPAARRRAEQQHQQAASSNGHTHRGQLHGQQHQNEGYPEAGGQANGRSSLDGGRNHHHHHHHHQHGEVQEDGGGGGGGGSEECGRSVYTLTSVLVHQGTSLHSGHYYAFVRDSNGGWSCMNDSHVYGTSLEQVRQEQAYLLFYTRQSMKLPRPAPPAPAAPASAAEGPEVQPRAVASGPSGASLTPKQVYGPQLPAHMARGSAATANGKGSSGSLGEAQPIPSPRPSRLAVASATPSARLPAKVTVTPRAPGSAINTAAAMAVGIVAATAGRAAVAAASTLGAAKPPTAHGRSGSGDLGRRTSDAGAATAASSGGGAASDPAGTATALRSGANAAASAPSASGATPGRRPAAPADSAGGELDARKRKREAQGPSTAAAPAAATAAAASDAAAAAGPDPDAREDGLRLAVEQEVAGLKACASWSDGIKRLRLSVEERLRDSSLPGAMREVVQVMQRSGMTLQQVLATGAGDPRRKGLNRNVPQGVLQHGTDELRKLLRPVLMLLGWLGGPVPVMLL